MFTTIMFMVFMAVIVIWQSLTTYTRFACPPQESWAINSWPLTIIFFFSITVNLCQIIVFTINFIQQKLDEIIQNVIMRQPRPVVP